MKKILIISYYFPPCSLTAAERVDSWAKNLHKFGFYPVIVTRKWENRLKTLKDISIPTSDGIVHEKNNKYEIYYMPYTGNLRDKIYNKFGEDKFSLIRKSLTFFELFFQFYYTKALPFSNLYKQSKELLKKEKFERLIISGNPFIQFKFGYLLNKKFNIKWIADYRDAWSTTEIYDTDSTVLRRFIHRLDCKFEKKWVSTAHKISASSGPIGKSIEKITGVESFPLYNGINFDDFNKVRTLEKRKKFTITYIGSLYDGQKIEFFCEAFKKLIEEVPGIKVQLLFPGLAFFGDQESRVKTALKDYESYFECSERIPREEILKLEKEAHLLLHVAWQGFQGIIASKIYEYIASGTKILVTPSDNGPIEEIVSSSKCGVSISDPDILLTFLKTEYQLFLDGKTEKNDINTKDAQQFSRLKQVEELVAKAIT